LANERIILGIDPGTNIMGYGLILVKGKKIELITLDVIKLSHLDTQALKLKQIFETVLAIIDKYNPDELAIEAPFFGKNVQSMLKLGRAQGVAMAAALYRDIPIFEYSPRKIKQSVTGKGNASKEQVAAMISNLLVMKGPAMPLDATDAIAAALCHYFQGGLDEGKKSYSGWEGYLKSNPDKLG
jgi:crossover junction endodeoxyribonuclease RuvC